MSQIKWYSMDVKDVLHKQNSDEHQGLTQQEADHRKQTIGTNELTEKKRINPITLFLNQFKDFMVLILVGAVLISGLLGEYLDAITIVAIIVMNGILGFIQEYRAEQSL